MYQFTLTSLDDGVIKCCWIRQSSLNTAPCADLTHSDASPHQVGWSKLCDSYGRERKHASRVMTMPLALRAVACRHCSELPNLKTGFSGMPTTHSLILRCPLERGETAFPKRHTLFQIVDPSYYCSTLACQVNVGFEAQWSKMLWPCLSADQICVRVPLFPTPLTSSFSASKYNLGVTCRC
jgi:hypothetical protein